MFRGGKQTKKKTGMFGSRCEEVRGLMVGCDGSGKTTMLYHLKLGETVTTVPTIGFNVESVELIGGSSNVSVAGLKGSRRTPLVNLTLWDIGGQAPIRALWKHYYQNTRIVIFVVDAHDRSRVSEAVTLFDNMMQDSELAAVPAVIVANKLDLPHCMSKEELATAFNVDARVLADPTQLIRVAAAQTGKYDDVTDTILDVLGKSNTTQNKGGATNAASTGNDGGEDEEEAQRAEEEREERLLLTAFHRLNRVLASLSVENKLLPPLHDETGGEEGSSLLPLSFVDDNVSKPICFSGVSIPVEVVTVIVSFLDFTCLVPPPTYHQSYQILNKCSNAKKKKDAAGKVDIVEDNGASAEQPLFVPSAAVLQALSSGESLWRVNKTLLCLCLTDAALRLLRLIESDDEVDDRIISYLVGGARCFFYLNVPSSLRPAHIRLCVVFTLLLSADAQQGGASNTFPLRSFLRNKDIQNAFVKSPTFADTSTSLYSIFFKAVFAMTSAMEMLATLAEEEEAKEEEEEEEEEDWGRFLDSSVEKEQEQEHWQRKPQKVKALLDVDLSLQSEYFERTVSNFCGLDREMTNSSSLDTVLTVLDFWHAQLTEAVCWCALNTPTIVSNDNNKSVTSAATSATSRRGSSICPIKRLRITSAIFRCSPPIARLLGHGCYQDVLLRDVDNRPLSHCMLTAILEVIVGATPCNHTEIVVLDLQFAGPALWAILKVIPFAAPNIQHISVIVKDWDVTHGDMGLSLESIEEEARKARWPDCKFDQEKSELFFTTHESGKNKENANKLQKRVEQLTSKY